jgi:CHAT domain-containing protein
VQVLEKCPTEMLSALSRVFLYAGARALLVSHWAVNSDATVKLITPLADRHGSRV